ncbi:MAG: hypothetical protein OXU70_08420, partial [Gammaproteobacteria bacterium]|nr:hypothetical protein [Gammaproteobacteria bacterium]
MRTKTRGTVIRILTAALAFATALSACSQGEQGEPEAPPAPQVVEAVESLIAEINVIHTAFGISEDYADAEPQANRDPVHVYAKTLEVHHKIRQLQAQNGLTAAPPRRMSFQPVNASDAIANLEHLVQQMRGIRDELAIDGDPERAPVAADATLSTAYGRLAVASLMLDELRGGPLTPSDSFQVASAALNNMEAIAEQLDIALEVQREAPPSAEPAKIAKDVMRSIERAIDVQAKLGMTPSTAPGVTPERVDSSQIYDLTGILVAELSRIGHHVGIEGEPRPVAESRNKTLIDVYARVLQINEGLEAFTGDRIELAVARMEEEARKAELPVAAAPQEPPDEQPEPADEPAVAAVPQEPPTDQ